MDRSQKKQATPPIAKLLGKRREWERLNLTHMELGDEGAKVIGKLLVDSQTTIGELRLRNNELTACGLAELARAFGQVKTLDLSGNFLPPRAAKAFGGTSIVNLNLARNPLEDEGARNLAKGMAASVLENLDVRGCGIEEEGVCSLVERLPDTLQVLVLAENVVGVHGADALAQVLPATSLQELVLYNSSLGAEGASTLAEKLSGWSGKKLDLCYNGIGDVGATDISQKWLGTSDCGLTWLSLTSNGIGPDGVKHIAEALACNKKLNELRLSRNDIGPGGLRALCETLTLNETLRVLALNRSGLGEEGAQIIGGLLSKMRGVEHLALQHNNFGDVGVQELANGLCLNESVKSLELGSNNIADEGAFAMAGALRFRDDFRRLFLDRNLIDDLGVEKIAIAIEEHKSIEDISLQKNKFGRWLESEVWGGYSFAVAVQRNQSLKSIDLSCNSIYMQGAEEFAAAANGNGPTLSLNISSCYIGASGACALAHTLRSNSRLMELLIDDNEIGDKGLSSISHALHGNHTLEKLSLRSNLIGNVGAHALSKALPRTSIQFLDLDDNTIEDDGAKQLALGAAEMKRLAEFRIANNPIQAEGCYALKKASWSNAVMFGKSPPKIRVPVLRQKRLCMPGLSVHDREGIDSLRYAWELLEVDAEPFPRAADEDVDLFPALLQRKLIKAMIPGANQHDPAQNHTAFADAQRRGLVRQIDVRYIRHCHDTISSVFRHGPHAGEPVTKLFDDLKSGKSPDEITPLVVVTLAGENWIVFGNRRLKCLKQLADEKRACVLMTCIVYDFDRDQDVPKCLLAKLLHGATTENDGVSVRFRKGNHAGDFEESYHGTSSHSEAVGRAIMSAPRLVGNEEAKCFLETTMLEDIDGRYAKVESLDVMDQILGDSGQAVRIRSKQVHPEQDQELVELHAGEAQLIISKSHRVMVNRSRSGPEAAPAGSLREGDDVLCRGKQLQKLTKVRHFTERVKLVEFQFEPDIPVAAFLPPSDMIMSKGRGRGRFNRRSKCRRVDDDIPSIPDTENSFQESSVQRSSPCNGYRKRPWKTEPCKYYNGSNGCRHGSACNFAHGDHELRVSA